FTRCFDFCVSSKGVSFEENREFAVVVLDRRLTGIPAKCRKAQSHRCSGYYKIERKRLENTLSVSGQKLTLDCPKCLPTQSVTVSISDISALRYGQNAYHHSVSGVATGIFSLGLGSSLV